MKEMKKRVIAVLLALFQIVAMISPIGVANAAVIDGGYNK